MCAPPDTGDLELTVSRTGELQSVDGYMNIALEKTEEYVNGVKRRAYGDAFVRGNNGKLVSCYLSPKSISASGSFSKLRLQSCTSPRTLRTWRDEDCSPA